MCCGVDRAAHLAEARVGAVRGVGQRHLLIEPRLDRRVDVSGRKELVGERNDRLRGRAHRRLGEEASHRGVDADGVGPVRVDHGLAVDVVRQERDRARAGRALDLAEAIGEASHGLHLEVALGRRQKEAAGVLWRGMEKEGECEKM